VETLTAYRQKIDRLKQNELNKALMELRSGSNPEQVVASLAHKLSNKIMHQPTQALKQAGAEGRDDLLEWAQTLLGIDVNDNPA
ncbi:MAG TPA: glutamyl-tRNA reductase, partial [Pseudomonadales bacterium]|nr:glutamyl-tRNA reductase [Pseudomonadales bacterium]